MKSPNSSQNMEVDLFALNLLKESGVAEPPTEINKLLKCSGLQIEEFLFPEELNYPQTLPKKIRGLIDIPERVILVSSLVHPKQKKFIIFHELAHYGLPWQKEILYFCSEHDLSPDVQKRFEREANRYAASCIFQGNRFSDEARDMKFGMETVIRLAKRYDASFEASCRRYVEESDESCTFCSLEPINGEDGTSVKLLYHIPSATFPYRFQKGSIYSPKHVLSQLCNESIEEDFIITQTSLNDDNGNKVIFETHMFFNSYNVLALFKPIKVL